MEDIIPSLSQWESTILPNLSGFSAELLKVFMEGVEFNPKAILNKLLGKYQVQIDPIEAQMTFAQLQAQAQAPAQAVKWFRAQARVQAPVQSQALMRDQVPVRYYAEEFELLE